MKIKIDRFVLSIIITIVVAYFFPQWGSKKSPIPLDTIGEIGVSLIFFFYGLKLSPEKIKSGLKNYKLHVVIQLSTFLLFPILVLSAYGLSKIAALPIAEQQTLWLALLFLAALPSTVSSSVVMVSIAKGNIPAAIFNASISGLIGIVITPLWMGVLLQNASAAGFDLTDIYLKLLLGILLPVVLGLLLQSWGGKYAKEYNEYLTLFDKSVILLIIYKSFSESFEQHIFQTVHWTDLAVISGAVLGLFYGVYFLIGKITNLLNFSIEDRITAQFCGTKKSLVHGTVFSKILFAGWPSVGIILLPLMLFHAFQLLIISAIAAKLGKREV